MSAKPLSDAQDAMLLAVQDGPKPYTGRAKRTVEVLAKRGLVTYTFDLVPRVGQWAERYTVEAVPLDKVPEEVLAIAVDAAKRGDQ